MENTYNLCPLGLTCFVSPIIGDGGTAAKITIGPFIMVEKQDFISCELTETLKLRNKTLQSATQSLQNIPFVSPDKVAPLSNLLFMSAVFMNNVYAENLLIESDRSHSIQGQIGDYIAQLKKVQLTFSIQLKKSSSCSNAFQTVKKKRLTKF